jgi:hypothetical protein
MISTPEHHEEKDGARSSGNNESPNNGVDAVLQSHFAKRRCQA